MKRSVREYMITCRYCIVIIMFFTEQIVLYFATRGISVDQKQSVFSDALLFSIAGIASIIIVIFGVVVMKFKSMIESSTQRPSINHSLKNSLFLFIFVGCISLFTLNVILHILSIIRREYFLPYYFMIPGLSFYASVFLCQTT